MRLTLQPLQSVFLSSRGSHGLQHYSCSCHCYCSNLWHDGLLWDEAKASPWARDPENPENTLFMSMYCDRATQIRDGGYFIIRQQRIPRAPKYNFWKRGGKISLFYNALYSLLSSMLWRFFTSEWSQDLFWWIMHIIIPHFLIRAVVQCIKVAVRWWQREFGLLDCVCESCKSKRKVDCRFYQICLLTVVLVQFFQAFAGHALN